MSKLATQNKNQQMFQSPSLHKAMSIKRSYQALGLFTGLTLFVCSNIWKTPNQKVSPALKEKVYIAVALNSATEQAVAKKVVEQKWEQMNPTDPLRVDYLVDNSTVVMSTSSPKQQDVRAITRLLPSLRSTDQALISVLYNTAALCDQNPRTPIEVIIVTEGFNSPTVFDETKKVSERLETCHDLRILVVGVDPSKEVTSRNVLSAIKDHVRFTSKNEEAMSLI